MNLTIPRKPLLSALRAVAVAAQSRGTMPILACVLLDARGGAVRLACTDLYRSASTSVAADVVEPGSVAVDVVALLARVDAMPDGPIAVTVADGRLTLRAGRRTHALHAVPGDDFPALPAAPSGESLDLRPLAEAVRRVVAAVSADETRAALNSLYIVREDDGTRVVATDGHRLHVARAGVELAANWLVPRAFARQLMASCSESTTAAAGGNSLTLSSGGVVHTTKLVDATFPPYSQVIPEKQPNAATVARDALVDALRSVSLASSDRTGGVRMTFDAGTLTISAESPDSGDSADTIDADYEGPRVQIGMNATYMLDALAAVDVDVVRLGFAGDLDPIVLRSADAGDDFAAVVMPMRI